MNDFSNKRLKSPYTLRENIKRVLWGTVQMTLFRTSFHNWYGVRRVMLRAFGANIHPTARIRRTVCIEIPWNLTVEEGSAIGDRAIVYCLGPIRIGKRTVVSQGAHLCAGSHDYTTPDFTLLRVPIDIGDDVWIAADAFVGPTVKVGCGAILGARACTMKDLDEWTIYAGNPAKAVKARPRFDQADQPADESDQEPPP